MIKTDTRTVSCRVAEHGWRALHADGLSPAEFTLHTGIAPGRLGQADGRINAEQHRRFVQYMQRLPPLCACEHTRPGSLERAV